MIPKHEQLDDYGYEVWEENSFPLAYLMTFRTYGTWLHGDERTSVKRDGWNRFGHPRYKENPTIERWMSEEMNSKPFILNARMRVVVDSSIRELCERRGFGLNAANVRLTMPTWCSQRHKSLSELSMPSKPMQRRHCVSTV